MPQIYMILSPKAQQVKGFTDTEMVIGGLAGCLVWVIEDILGIQGKKDVAFTAVPALYTNGEADVQIEIRYTAGEDEYDQGEPFDPSLATQNRLIDHIKRSFCAYLDRIKLPKLSVSVWCKPYYKSRFKIFD